MRAIPTVILAAVAGAAAAQEPPPVETGLTESVEVRLVTIDVVALDADDRAVPGLTKTDFKLTVDGKDTPIDTLDVLCGDAPADDPNSKRFGKWATPANVAQGTRRIVFVFDYLHLGMLAGETLQALQDVLSAKTEINDEEVMVVALTGGLRVEQAFSRDRVALVETLRRMEHDITLWNGNFSHLTERPLFGGLDALMTILRTVPGSKAVVFISAWSGSDIYNDLDFEDLAARASDAQVALYPYSAQGLTPGLGPTGGPRGLARMASSTGGRLTKFTNDPTIAYARARRDLGCRYTIGFYDRKPEEGRQHSVRVRAARDDLRVIHPERYSFPSREQRREMSVEAAYLAPQMFGGGGMRAHVFPIAPKDASLWEALIAVEFPVPVAGGEQSTTTREFGVVVERGSEVAHSFHRTITLTATDEPNGTATHRITFLEPAHLKPGRYTIRAVLADPGSETPFAQRTDVSVPEIPRGAPFLVGPTLGRGGDDEVVVFGGTGADGKPSDRVGGASDFRPLMVAEADRDAQIAAITQLCIVKPRKGAGPWVVERALLAEGGEPVASLAGISVAPEPKRAVSCQRVVDQLEVRDLPLGRYTFQAVVAEETRRVPIALVAD